MCAKKRFTYQEYVEGILSQDQNILSQTITLIESKLKTDQQIAQQVLKKILPYTTQSLRIGITGIPGSGKSTLIETLGNHILRAGKKLAVLTIDPSSIRSKGSILGDKTRMKMLSQHPSAFVRPSPSGSSLGGVGYKTRECILLCEAAGYDIVIVETIGVGQSETMVHAMTDFFLLLMLPGTGDELQGIKRGIIEMADLIAINKADGQRKQPAKEARNIYEQVLYLFRNTKSGWEPKVITCSALKEEGIDVMWTLIGQYQDITQQNGYFDQRRREQNLYWMHEIIQQLLKDHFYQHPKIREALPALEDQVVAGKTTALNAARKLMELEREPTDSSNLEEK